MPDEAEVLSGGLEDGAPAEPESEAGSASPAPASAPGGETPGITEVTIGGQKFSVTEEMAAAFAAQEEARKREFNELNTAVQDLRSRVPDVAPEHEPQTVGRYDYSTKLFEAPDEAISQLKNEIREELTQQYQQARQAETAQEKFWNGFYKDYPELSENRILVEAIMTRDADLAGMTVETGKRALADRAIDELNRIRGGKVQSGGKPPIVEGAPEKAPTTEPATPKAEKQTSLGDVLRQRAKDRADSRRGNIRVVK